MCDYVFCKEWSLAKIGKQVKSTPHHNLNAEYCIHHQCKICVSFNEEGKLITLSPLDVCKTHWCYKCQKECESADKCIEHICNVGTCIAPGKNRKCVNVCPKCLANHSVTGRLCDDCACNYCHRPIIDGKIVCEFHIDTEKKQHICVGCGKDLEDRSKFLCKDCTCVVCSNYTKKIVCPWHECNTCFNFIKNREDTCYAGSKVHCDMMFSGRKFSSFELDPKNETECPVKFLEEGYCEVMGPNCSLEIIDRSGMFISGLSLLEKYSPGEYKDIVEATTCFNCKPKLCKMQDCLIHTYGDLCIFHLHNETICCVDSCKEIIKMENTILEYDFVKNTTKVSKVENYETKQLCKKHSESFMIHYGHNELFPIWMEQFRTLTAKGFWLLHDNETVHLRDYLMTGSLMKFHKYWKCDWLSEFQFQMIALYVFGSFERDEIPNKMSSELALCKRMGFDFWKSYKGVIHESSISWLLLLTELPKHLIVKIVLEAFKD